LAPGSSLEIQKHPALKENDASVEQLADVVSSKINEALGLAKGIASSSSSQALVQSATAIAETKEATEETAASTEQQDKGIQRTSTGEATRKAVSYAADALAALLSATAAGFDMFDSSKASSTDAVDPAEQISGKLLTPQRPHSTSSTIEPAPSSSTGAPASGPRIIKVKAGSLPTVPPLVFEPSLSSSSIMFAANPSITEGVAAKSARMATHGPGKEGWAVAVTPVPLPSRRGTIAWSVTITNLNSSGPGISLGVSARLPPSALSVS
jgi:hypothetical protein